MTRVWWRLETRMNPRGVEPLSKRGYWRPELRRVNRYAPRRAVGFAWLRFRLFFWYRDR
jgi:hypothetical protein